MASDELLAVLSAASVVTTVAISAAKKRRKRNRSVWVRPLFLRRGELGAYHLLMNELRATDTEMYTGFTRFTPDDFDTLLSMVTADISGSSRFRLPIPADVRLALTLRYLATGEYRPNLLTLFGNVLVSATGCPLRNDCYGVDRS